MEYILPHHSKYFYIGFSHIFLEKWEIFQNLKSDNFSKFENIFNVIIPKYSILFPLYNECACYIIITFISYINFLSFLI